MYDDDDECLKNESVCHATRNEESTNESSGSILRPSTREHQKVQNGGAMTMIHVGCVDSSIPTKLYT